MPEPEKIKGLSTVNSAPAVKDAPKDAPEDDAEPEVKDEESELDEDERARREMRDAYLRMWPLAAQEKR